MFGRAIVRGLVATTVMAFAVVAQAITIDMVPVGNPGNAGDTRVMTDSTSGYGAVSYAYSIGKYEVTAGEYAAFLNAVAANDPYGLYNSKMDYDANVSATGCNIKRSGVSGSYTYSVATDWANRPVNYVSWGDTVRFCNWLYNGQPTGTLTGTPALDARLTEDGSYYLNGATGFSLQTVTRKATAATWVLPTENEWYKAAFYDPNKLDGAGYWKFATGTDSRPGDDTTEATNPGNNANYHDPYTPSDVIGAPYYRTNVGTFTLSDSPYGTFDQNGNVSEWYEGTYLSSARDGGAFDSNSSSLAADWRNDLFINSRAGEGGLRLGFRVGYVPEPSSIVLLFAAAASLLAYAWRRRGQAA